MLNPLFAAGEIELHGQLDEIKFGIYEVSSFKGKYLNVKLLLKSASETLEPPSKDRHRLAFVGVARAATLFRHKLSRSAEESKPLVMSQPTFDDNDEERDGKGLPQRWYSAVSDPSEAEYLEPELIEEASSNDNIRTFEQEFRIEVNRVVDLCCDAVERCRSMLDMVKSSLEQTNMQLNAMQRNAFRVELKDIYHRLHQVSQFANANHTMAARLLHCKVVVDSRFGPRIRSDLSVFTKNLFEKNELESQAMVQQVEALFAHYFGVGDKDIARFELLSYLTGGRSAPDALLGLFLGFVLAATAFTLAFVFFSPLGQQALNEEGLGSIYRGLTVFAMLPWVNLIVIYIWRHNRVNYVLLFHMDHHGREYHRIQRIALRACVSTMLLLVSLVSCLIFLYLDHRALACACPVAVLPFFLTAFYVSPFLRHSLNSSLYENALGLLGLAPITFSIVFRTDIMTSLSKPLGDFARLLCSAVYFTEWGVGDADNRTCATSFTLNKVIVPFLAAYPLWLRMVQNLRQTYENRKTWPYFFNALKYAFSMEVVVISTLKIEVLGQSSFFRFVFVTTSLVTFAWDVFMDFGLGRPQYYGLRDRLMYSNKAFYYSAILLDLVLRFGWTLTLVSPDYMTAQTFPIIIPVGGNVPANFLEIFRRTIWSIIRVENEHLNNTLRYREVDFVPLYFPEDEEKSQKEEQENERIMQDNGLYVAAFARVVFLLVAVVSISGWILKRYH